MTESSPNLRAACLEADSETISRQASRLNAAAIDYRLGLDELDTISRTRAGYAFTELPPELQEAVLSLIFTRDLTSRRLDLTFWLEDLLSATTAKML